MADENAREPSLSAPLQVEMGAAQLDNYFAPNALLVKQTMRGCLQECLGCEAKSEFEVAPMDWSQLDGFRLGDAALNEKNILYALENSSCFCRLCWRDGRPFNMEVKQWVADAKTQKETAGTGQPIVNYKKDCGMPLNMTIPLGENGDVTCPCCCMLPAVEMTTPDGSPLQSKSQYICDINLFVPKLAYEEPIGTPVYMVKPETCCGGCCLKCNCKGKGSLFVPFYFHDPQTGEPIVPYGPDAPQIRKVWAGWKKECCSTADTYAMKFPDGIDSKRKAGLLGMAFLIDFTVFEKQGEGQ